MSTPTQMVPIKNLIPTYTDAESNPNRMSADEFALLVRMIQANGFLQPLLVHLQPGSCTKYVVIDGHHRLRAATEAGLTELPVVRTTASEGARALGIGMNRARGELDLSLAVEELKALHDSTQWDAERLSTLSGFSPEEIESLVINAEDELVLDEMPALPAREETGATADKLYVLEIPFEDREQYKLARRKLKRAAGTGNPLSAGLLALLGEEV